MKPGKTDIGLLVKTHPVFTNYAISRDGRVWSKPRTTPHGHKRKGRWLKLSPLKGGYIRVDLKLAKKSYTLKVHRLVLETWVGLCPVGMNTRHLDGNPANNNLSNLQWGTFGENWDDRRKHGKICSPRGEINGQAKLREKQVRSIYHIYHNRIYNQYELADMFGVSVMTICRIVNKKSWKHLWRIN